MKKIIVEILLTCAVITPFSCSPSAYVEKETGLNLSSYKTYMWVSTMATQDETSARATTFADLPVMNAVNEELQHLGWKEAVNNPEVLVSYDILVESNVSTQSDPFYLQPYSRWYYNRFSKRWSGIYYPSQFLGYRQYEVTDREATMTITMMMADSDKKIWQGWTTEKLGGTGITDLNIKKSVKNIFKESGKIDAKEFAAK